MPNHSAQAPATAALVRASLLGFPPSGVSWEPVGEELEHVIGRGEVRGSRQDVPLPSASLSIAFRAQLAIGLSMVSSFPDKGVHSASRQLQV